MSQDEIEAEGTVYKAKEAEHLSCEGCAFEFNPSGCWRIDLPCFSSDREDGRSVIFTKEA
ncbi:MAG: hypothetical protein ACRCUS_00940 [Anaerovoracaceae bacterium]